MKLLKFIVFLIFLGLNSTQSNANIEKSQLSLATTGLLEVYKSIAQLNSNEFKNVGYAIELLTNLTNKLVNSSNQTCLEYILIKKIFIIFFFNNLLVYQIVMKIV